MLDTDPGPGECDTTGAGLCNGELCCIIGDADGDIIGLCDVGCIGDETGCLKGDCVWPIKRGDWPGPGRLVCLFRYSLKNNI